MARRSQCSDAGDNPLDPNHLPPHYREEYRMAIDALVEQDVDGYYKFLQLADVVDFLSPSEIDFIQNSIQVPNQVGHPEHPFLDTGGDGSSDTYWPLHSDLDAPGLDLGWPQTHHFMGPTEVTTLVNPAAPDMPSIKEQARRLIKNAQMVIAIVMDMFTDVDIFADILNAAMRNVAVYILLDEANVDHFINMVSNCRVNLPSIQFLRVRTVSGITYHCRSGKSFKGQMLDRFILTDCRAVLSGNYSFMWSYEKLHRCMAHLFLGQLVSTFDEEFRILFAQSEPLIIENMEDVNILQKPPYPGERPVLRDTRKYRTMDTAHPEDWPRQPYDERVDMDWRMMPLKRQETFHGPVDLYNRYPSPQTRLEPQFDQGPPRMPMIEGLTHKRHSFAEGAPGRYNLPYQQGLPEVEPPARPYYRGQPLQPGQVHEPDYGGYNKGGYDKFWNQDFHQEEQYPEPGFPQEIEPHEGYGPVMNYLSSTRNVDVDQSSDKLIPGPDLPYATTHPRRSRGHAYACQTSPTPSNTTEKKLFQEHTSDRKDPTVKKGLRNWRISSYLSAYDSSGEPEGLPMGPGQAIDPFEEFPNPMQQPTPPPPPALEIPGPKIPNVREFKVPALPRASQMPAFAKTTLRDLSKKFPDEPPPFTVPVLGVPEITKTTPTPSESSSTTDGEKQDEVEPRQPKVSALKREDSFRRNYNAAVHRSSRLRSSLIFSSLDQNTTQDNCKTGEQEGEGTKVETETTKLPFVSQVLTQRRSGTREPFEWKSYIKTPDTAKTEEDSGKQAEKDSTTNSKLDTLSESHRALKPQDVAPNVQKVDVSLPKQIEPPKTEPLPPPASQQPTKSFLNEPFLDMNDPDQRLMFFKELAAKRRAAKAAEEAKIKHESDSKVNKDEPAKEEAGSSKQESKKPTEDAKKTEANTPDVSGKIDKPEIVVKKDPTSSCEKIEMKIATDSEKIESKQSQVSLPVSTEKQTEQKQPKLDKSNPKPALQDKPIDPPVATTSANAELVTEEKTTSKATSKGPQLKASSSVPDFGKIIGSDLLSSLPSSRLYERSMSQEKDIQAKSRLWSPLLHKREVLKLYTDNKQKGLSTVIQVEESPEESSKTATSDLASDAAKSEEKPKVDFQISDITQPIPLQNKDSISSGIENKESIKEFSVLPAISEKEQPQKKPLVRFLSSGTPSKLDTNESPISFTSTQAPTQDKSKILPFTLDKLQPHKEEFPTQPLSGKETLNKESLVKSTASEDHKDTSKGATQLQLTTSQLHQPENKESVVKSSGEQIKESGKMPSPSQSESKAEPKQSLDQTIKENSISGVIGDSTQKPDILQSAVSTGQETYSSTSPPISEKTDLQEPAKQHAEKAAEKTNVEVDEDTKTSSQTGTNSAISQDKMDKLPAASEKDTQQSDKENLEGAKHVATSSDKDTTEKTAQVHTAEEKSNPISQKDLTQEEVIQNPATNISDSEEPEKSSSTTLSKKINVVEVAQTIEEAKFKSPITYAEEFQIESHSNTSSPASFATALEFISSEDSDMLSPAKTDPHHLFKTGNHSSSVSDLSDFETPSSDLSRSPMPATNLDDTTEDNISVAETVIEAAPRRISASTEGVKVHTDPAKPALESQQSDSLSQNENLSPAKSSEEAKMSATTQIEIRDGSVTRQGTTTESSTKETSNQKEASKKADSTDVKTNDLTIQSETKAANDTQIELNKKPVVPPTSPATSQEKLDTKLPVSTKDTSKPSDETSLENKTEVCQKSTDVKDQGIGASTVRSESETKLVSSNTCPATSQEAKMPDKTKEQVTEETKMVDKTSGSTTAPTEKSNIESKTEADTDSKSKDAETQDVTSKSISSPTTQSPTNRGSSEVTQETKIMVDQTSEIIAKETSKPEDKSKESNTTDTNVKTKDVEAPNKSISSEKAADQVRQNISEPANVKTNETAPPSQPKQSKPMQSRYLSSTANVISSSNLRDDTKILLEQISANSQNRNESSTTKEAPVTDDEKEDEADKNSKRKKENELKIKSLGQPKSSQDRDKVLERIQTMRSNRKVYSRFEV